jgi:hypothetical protein
MRTHQTTNRKSAGVSASKLLKKPNVSSYLEKHVNSARKRVVALVDGAGKEEIQLRASQDILDRTFGKPTSRTEAIVSGVQLNIDITSALEES